MRSLLGAAFAAALIFGGMAALPARAQTEAPAQTPAPILADEAAVIARVKQIRVLVDKAADPSGLDASLTPDQIESAVAASRARVAEAKAQFAALPPLTIAPDAPPLTASSLRFTEQVFDDSIRASEQMHRELLNLASAQRAGKRDRIQAAGRQVVAASAGLLSINAQRLRAWAQSEEVNVLTHALLGSAASTEAIAVSLQLIAGSVQPNAAKTRLAELSGEMRTNAASAQRFFETAALGAPPNEPGVQEARALISSVIRELHASANRTDSFAASFDHRRDFDAYYAGWVQSQTTSRASFEALGALAERLSAR